MLSGLGAGRSCFHGDGQVQDLSGYDLPVRHCAEPQHKLQGSHNFEGKCAENRDPVARLCPVRHRQASGSVGQPAKGPRQAQGWPAAPAASEAPGALPLQGSGCAVQGFTNSLRLWMVAGAKAWGMQVVHLIRHGESEFNAAASSSKSWEDPQIYNPNLTIKGQAQVGHTHPEPSTPNP